MAHIENRFSALGLRRTMRRPVVNKKRFVLKEKCFVKKNFMKFCIFLTDLFSHTPTVVKLKILSFIQFYLFVYHFRKINRVSLTFLFSFLEMLTFFCLNFFAIKNGSRGGYLCTTEGKLGHNIVKRLNEWRRWTWTLNFIHTDTPLVQI